MSTALTAADNIRNLLTKFAGLAELGAFLEQHGQLEEWAASCVRAAKDAEAAKAKAEADLEGVREAARVTKDQAENILAQAKSDAQDLSARAGEQAQGTINEAQAEVDALAARSTELQAEVEQMQANAAQVQAALDADIAQRQKVLDGINKQIDALRVKLG